ncbi:MAG: hypothetical protein IKM31_07735 [Oscillospiraceae bacterium]|nr:hypothetical protein [Oscillospiraceae bacterium]
MGKWIMPAAILAAGTVVCTMFLGGCRENDSALTAEDMASLGTGSWTASAEVTMDEMEAGISLLRQGDLTEITVTSPEHLEGLVFRMDGGDSSVSFKGLAVEGAELPLSSLGAAVDGALDVFARPELLTAGVAGDGAPVFRGESSAGRFALTLPDGLPGLLEMEETGLTIRFSNVVFSEDGGTPLPEE